MRNILILFLLTLASSVSAQLTVRDVYPVAKDLKIDKKQDNFYTDYELSTCVSGDCKNGNGIWLRVDPNISGSTSNGRSELGYKNYNSYEFTYFLYVGTFSNNGANFEGKIISDWLYYEQKIGSTKAKPVERYDFTKLINNREDLLFEGKFESYAVDDKLYYRRKEGNARWEEAEDNKVESIYRWYHEDDEDMVQIIYKKDAQTLLKKATGVQDQGGRFVLGKFEYKDGSQYIGFMYNNKKQGSGVYTNSKKEVTQGLWMDDNLEYQMEISIPSAAYDATAKQELQPAEFTHAGISSKGQKLVDKKTSISFYFSNDHKLFYHGYLKDNAPDVLGCYVNIQAGEKKHSAVTETPQAYETGIYNTDELIEGLKVTQDYVESNRDDVPNTYWDILVRKGSFIKGDLTGCGSREYIESGRYTFEKGEFVKGKITGWHHLIYKYKYQNDDINTITHTQILKPTTNTDFEKLATFPVSDCLKDSIGDVKSFVANLKAEIDYKSNRETVKGISVPTISSIHQSSEKVTASTLKDKSFSLIYLATEKKAFYLNNYNPQSKTFTLLAKTYVPSNRAYVIDSRKLKVSDGLYFMRRRTSSEELEKCPKCDWGQKTKTRTELVKKPGLKRTTKNFIVHTEGYKDTVTGEFFHYEPRDVFYKETCTDCSGTGKVSTNSIKYNYDLLEIVD